MSPRSAPLSAWRRTADGEHEKVAELIAHELLGGLTAAATSTVGRGAKKETDVRRDSPRRKRRRRERLSMTTTAWRRRRSKQIVGEDVEKEPGEVSTWVLFSMPFLWPGHLW